MGVGVVRGEGAVSVPLRRLFRYEWMDVILLLPVLVNLSSNCEAYRTDGFALASTLYASAGSRVTARNTMTARTICC
jgi:hypothetical protein